MHFRVTSEPLSLSPSVHAEAGGYVSFEGRVRNEHAGRSVLALEYEAHAEMAISQGEALLREAIERFGLIDATCVHRVGRLVVGEIAVTIEVSAPHRREAFAGCEFIIDELKKRVPIWKKEHYAEGDSGWIGISDQAVTPAAMYARQSRLGEIGEAGQTRLREAKVLVVGAGGLGCAALPYLVASGVGTVGICDGDRVEVSNLHRQPLYGVAELGRPKADCATIAMARLSPFVKLNTHRCRITKANADEIVRGYDIIIDGTDNFRTKFLLNRICRALGKTLIVAGIYKFDGQLLSITPDSEAGCLRCVWPSQPTDGCVGTCADTGVLGVLPGFFGVLQATEAIKVILGLASPAASNVMLYDLLDSSQMTLPRRRDPNCPVCNGIDEADDGLIDDPREAVGMIAVDIREVDEPRPRGQLANLHWVDLPLSTFNQEHLPAGKRLLICKSGRRSGQLLERLRSEGVSDVYSLVGGMDLHA